MKRCKLEVQTTKSIIPFYLNGNVLQSVFQWKNSSEKKPNQYFKNMSGPSFELSFKRFAKEKIRRMFEFDLYRENEVKHYQI